MRATVGSTSPERLRAGGPTRRLHCPSHGTALIALHHHGIEVDTCPQCAGVWLGAGEHDRIPAAQRMPPDGRSRVATTVDGLAQSVDLIEIAGKSADKLHEFIGDAFSALRAAPRLPQAPGVTRIRLRCWSSPAPQPISSTAIRPSATVIA